MKKLMLLSLLIVFAGNTFAQNESFDLTTFTPPKGWDKKEGKDAIQLSKHDEKSDSYCLITLYKSTPGTANSKENFDMAWASLVNETITVSTAPEMQPAATENGWEIQSGHAPYESEGTKGVAMLVTASSAEKMVNMIILTNTDVYEKEMTAFIESISLKKLETVPVGQPENLQQSTNTSKETFDLITYSPPKGWTKNVEETLVSYTITDNSKNTWCRINIVKSTISKGSIEADFESEWQELVVKNYNPTDSRKENEVQEADGWKTKTGTCKFTFNDNEAMAMLTTASGYDTCVSIVAVTNDQDYLKDIQALIESIDLIKPEIASPETPIANNDENSIIGIWATSASDQSTYAVQNGVNGYIKRQYNFNTNGTYTFIVKTFQYTSDKILLTKESGKFQINGNNITIDPQKGFIEAWSKKDNADNWGKLLSSENSTLEKVTYLFTKHYFSGIQIWNLVLQNNTVTQRDGPHSNNKSFDNAWYYGPISANNPVIELPNGQMIITEVKPAPVAQTANTSNSTLIGTWDIHASEKTGNSSNNYMISGYVNRQYTFNANGTYKFYNKTYQMFSDKMFLTKENGTYQINGDNVTIYPQTSVIEAWSRQGNNDVWGKKLSTQNIALEKVTYHFSKEYISEMNEWKLYLQADNQTKRDGAFNNYERNAWVYIITSPSRQIIKLPGE